MHIIVCIKQVPDHEGPRDAFVVNSEKNCVEPKGIPPVLSLFDENALEAALKIKDKAEEEVKITVLSIGKRVANAVMIKALAAGADEIIKVEDPDFESENLDSHLAAELLAKTIKKIGDWDLILVGRQASDWNSGQTGIYLAGNLDVPCITLAQKIDVEIGNIIVERVQPDGREVVKCALPAVVMVSNELGELRYPAMKERREARKKPVVAWGVGDIDFDGDLKKRIIVKRLYQPELEKGHCQIIEGSSSAEAGRNLAQRLREENVI